MLSHQAAVDAAYREAMHIAVRVEPEQLPMTIATKAAWGRGEQMTATTTFESGWLWERWLSMLNGNFYKLMTLVILLGLGLLTIWQQTNYGRLEERIAGLQSTLALTSRQAVEIQAALQARQDKMREQLAELNAEVQGYRMLPTQMVTNSKAIEQTRAQMNMVLYRVLGMERGEKPPNTPCVGDEC